MKHARFGRMLFAMDQATCGPFLLSMVLVINHMVVLTAEWTSIDLQVRLVDGPTKRKGRLEVRRAGSDWGTVCDDHFGRNDATVVCRQLHFGERGTAIPESAYGSGSGAMYLDDMQCKGTEPNLGHCLHRGWKTHDCFSSEAVGVDCGPEDLQVRLVDGPTEWQGRLEVRRNSSDWGTVCDDGFGSNDATVVCRQLHFGALGTAIPNSAYGSGSGAIYLDDMQCKGTEPNLGHCLHRGWKTHDCSSSEAVGVDCGPEDLQVRLVDGPTETEGRLEVRRNGSNWGIVCDDYFDSKDATVVCRQLHFGERGTVIPESAYGWGPGTIYLDDMQCQGTESNLGQCLHQGWRTHDCSSREAVGVRCEDCDPGKYGANCELKCSENCKSVSCDRDSGHCTGGCKSGWKPSDRTCKLQCDAGEWGENCHSTCSENCQDPSACDKKTGQCACNSGYQQPLCTEKCQVGSYGQDCLGKCGQCRDGHSDCHHVTGRCTRCKDNWELPLCQKCIPGKFGTTCSLDCGACGGDGRCGRVTGLCLSAFCQPGWKSRKCDQKCPPGSYGEDCTHQCGACKNESPCRHDNGVCEQDCEEGFEGVLCQRSKPSLMVPVVGAVVGAGALIAITIVFFVWCLKYRRSRFKSLPMTQSKEDLSTMVEMAAVDPIDIPSTSSSSQVYQNMQVSHIGTDATEVVNPAANCDRMDMAKRAEGVHHCEVHSTLQREIGGLLNGQPDNPEDQDIYEVMAPPVTYKH